jgi:hypothetical protein
MLAQTLRRGGCLTSSSRVKRTNLLSTQMLPCFSKPCAEKDRNSLASIDGLPTNVKDAGQKRSLSRNAYRHDYASKNATDFVTAESQHREECNSVDVSCGAMPLD